MLRKIAVFTIIASILLFVLGSVVEIFLFFGYAVLSVGTISFIGLLFKRMFIDKE